jgi:hypothetical protein
VIIRDLTEASGYIARNAEEARDPRWSASLSVDVKTDTMRKQISAFFPTTAPNDGQEQVKEAMEITMENNQLNEGMGSVNVDTEIDISRIRKLAGLANSTSAAGIPVSEEVEADISPEEAEAIADQLEEQLEVMNHALDSIEGIVRRYLPREYRYMESYTFAHIKTSLGGHGYVDRMTRSIESLIEDLRDHQPYDDEEM